MKLDKTHANMSNYALENLLDSMKNIFIFAKEDPLLYAHMVYLPQFSAYPFYMVENHLTSKLPARFTSKSITIGIFRSFVMVPYTEIEFEIEIYSSSSEYKIEHMEYFL